MVDATRTPAPVMVTLPRRHLRTMIRLVRDLDDLLAVPGYLAQVEEALPAVARFHPGHAAVMMGYDFHLTPEGPRLIEVNTNAGGGLLAYQAHYPDFRADPEQLPLGLLLGDRPLLHLLDSFSQEMGLWTSGPARLPRRLVIMDAEPTQQFLYPETRMMAGLFRHLGVATDLVDPGELDASEQGVWYHGAPVEMIYNRHCDFYLEEPALAGVRAAYLAGRVCLSPNPRAYGLLADKRRMILWCRPDLLTELGVPEATARRIGAVVPSTRLLADLNPEAAWAIRRESVFKPVTESGSRGVLLGEKISRKRFGEMDPARTLVQERVPPSLTVLGGAETPMKTDYRLFVYRQRILAAAARVYRGQVTNFREPGSGYAPLMVTGQ
ncbi:MAG: hypothetical protein HQL82_06270 [Magnetococcales bacterium]|nr:hypothetical protein [Magnetococcales bacterium]